MNVPRYDYEFAELTNRHGHGIVRRTDRQTGRQISFGVTVNDDDLVLRRLAAMEPEIADLVDLGVAVHTADRLTTRRRDLVSHIHIILPIRRIDIFNSSRVLDALDHVLTWYTGDRWTFEFTRRSDMRRLAEHTVHLPYTTESTQSCEVALWSGGLDSLAGLCARLMGDNGQSKNYTLLSTGSNSYMDGVQRHVASEVRAIQGMANRLRFVRIPIRFRQTGGMGKDPYMRSRGFSFLLMGAACALVEEQAVLHVYENGVGALNLPYRAAEVTHDHSRSVHPLSLHHMSDLVSQVLGQRFAYENPFLLNTKAQMCGSLIKAGLTGIVPATVSCDSRHREEAIQCGYCSSCLLRRLALAAQGINDHTHYVINQAARPTPRDASLHLRTMERQLLVLRSALHAPDPWYDLSGHFEHLDEVAIRLAGKHHLTVPVMRERLIGLYGAYVQEWDAVLPLGSNWLRATSHDAV